MIVEELSEAMDQHRLRTMQDIDRVEEGTSADSGGGGEVQVKDLRRGLNRVRIIATGSVTHSCALTDKTKSLVRSIIKVW